MLKIKDFSGSSPAALNTISKLISRILSENLGSDNKLSIASIKMITINKFLCCLKLELGGLLLGYINALASIVAIYFIVFNCELIKWI